MRLEQVTFKGYKRLVDTSFYVNRRLVAIVGPNEAGKSSILNALSTLDTPDPIPDSERSRTADRHDDVPIVTATYRYDATDQKKLSKLPLANPIETATRAKISDGHVVVEFSPQISYPFELFDNAHRALVELVSRLDKLQSIVDFTSTSEDGTLRNHAALMAGALPMWADPAKQASISGEQWDSIWEVRSRWDDHNGTRGEVKRWAALSKYYDEVAASPSLRERVLQERPIPPFQTFKESDRDLRNEYDLAQYSDQSELPAPLRNLLDFAELTLTQLQRAFTDEPLGETTIGPANDRIREKFLSRWKQSDVSVHLKLTGSILKVFVEDISTKAKAFFSERSDGLRMFVALMLFLEGKSDSTEPILLIDEADVHLHLDAQADLIAILTRFMAVSQVIYTTHSPGCLPPDLGTGVRFLEPSNDPPGSSSVVPFFWSKTTTKRSSGLLPLLFMLGARSAAFSRLRNAVVVEGQTEALLMPSLIRTANRLDELDYQLVPGLSQASTAEFEELNSVAVRVTYLVDGDSGGDELKTWLYDRRVPAAKIQQLGRGYAIEDLLDPVVYATAINKLAPASTPFAPSAQGGLVKNQAAVWAKGQNVRLPGPVVVAEMILTLVEAHEIQLKLREECSQDLVRIHAALSRQFEPKINSQPEQ